MGYIYKISTSCSDKIYIEKTQQSIQNRYQEHVKQYRNGVKYHLYNAMRKYGVDTFQVNLIEECDNDILNEREKYWIQHYDSFYNGYNMTLGGEGNALYDYKEIADKYLELQSEKEVAKYFNCSYVTVRKACETYGIIIKQGGLTKYWNSEKGQLRKEEMSKKWKNNNPNKNGLSEEHKKKLSNAKKEYYKNHDNYFKGKKFSEKHKQNLIKNSAMAKSVLCIETGIIYSSALQAAKAVGLKSSAGINKCCNGQRNTAGGYSWQYAS